MARSKPEPIDAPSTEAPEPTFAQMWDSFEPGKRVSRGVYSIFKTDDGGMHLAYRPEGADEDAHFPLPAMMMQMLIAATEGKGPFGRLAAVAQARFGG